MSLAALQKTTMNIRNDQVLRAMDAMDKRLMKNQWVEACELARHNIAFEILDAAMNGTRYAPEALGTPVDPTELYMKYLDTLRVLGELASRADMAEVCMADECNAVYSDAAAFLNGRVKLRGFETHGWAVEPL
jgi:hypothetical protein